MSRYSRDLYLKRRNKLPRKNRLCALKGCKKELPRFGEKRHTKYCCEEHAKEAKKQYKEEWEKLHPDQVKQWRSKYYKKYKKKRKKKPKINKPKIITKIKPDVHKENKIRKLQKVRADGAFPEY